MKWPSMQADVTPVGDGVALLINITYDREGELGRRPGLGDRLTLSSSLYGAVNHPEGGRFFVVVSGTNLVGYDLDNGALFTIYAIGAAYAGACFANAAGQLYYADGLRPMQVIARGDQVSASAGIAGPVAAPTATSASTGVIIAGVHLFRYRYKNAVTGYYSDPSPSVTITTLAAKNQPFTFVASLDAKTTNIIVEMTVASGSEFFIAGIFANGTSGTVNITDDSLSVQVPSLSYAPPDGFGHSQPPIAALLVEHRGRLFAWGSKTITGATATVTSASTAVDLGADATIGYAYVGRVIRFASQNAVYSIVSGIGSNVVLNVAYVGSTLSNVSFVITDPGEDTAWWSRAGYPEGWNLTFWQRSILQGMNADTPAAMLTYFNDLYFCGQRSMRRFNYDDDPARAELVTVSLNLGAYNQQCVVHADGQAFGWGMSGAWRLRGTNPQHISRPVDKYVRSIKDDTYSSQYFGFFDSVERVVWWCFVHTGETTVRWAFCLDIDSERWSIRRFRHQVRAAFTYGDAQLAECVYIGTGNSPGYTWKLAENRFDCLPTTMTSGILTTAAGAGTTVVPVQETVGDVVGAIAYRPDTGEERTISAYGANSITVGTAFATIPSIGEEIYVGSIPVEVLPFWSVYQNRLANKSRPSRLEFEARLVDNPVAALGQIYLDFSATAFNFGDLFTDDTENYGVTAVDSTTKGLDLSVLLVSMPCPSSWSRCLRYRFLQEAPEGQLALLSAGFFGDPPDVKTDVTS